MNCELDDISDADLITRARDGDSLAYGVLWKRHWQAARAMAASVTGRFEPDDLASEAFARILKAIESGKGPRTGFRSYLATTVRNVAIDWSRRKSAPNLEDPDAIEDWTYSEITTLEKIDRETIAKAFYALPESWQEVLWYMEVEDMSPREVAPLLGLNPNAVSALASRAREGLRQAWIYAHLAEAGPGDPAHAWTLKKLGSHVRGRLSKADRRRVTAHLEDCATCSNAASEADRIGSRLALGLLPLFLGVGGAAAYLQWIDAPSSAVAATASGVPSLSAGGRVRHLLNTAASGSHVGLTAVAASVAVAAVLTTGTIVATQQTAAPTAAAGTDPATQPRRETQPELTANDHADPAAGAPTDIRVNDPARPSSPNAPPAPAAPAAETAQADESANADAGSPGAPNAPTPPTPIPTPTEIQTPASVAGREAAVRSIPAEHTLSAYRLGDGDAADAVDFIHQGRACYQPAAGGAGWSLSDGTLRPPSDVFSVQTWFKTTAGGGRLIGFSSATTGRSTRYDRHLFLTDDGRVVFGVFPGTVHTIVSAQSYADDRWHQATATLSSAGMSLYVDGEQVSHDGTVVSGEGVAGYWRVGYDNLDAWGRETPARRVFAGALEYAAVYSVALTPEQVRTQWILGK